MCMSWRGFSLQRQDFVQTPRKEHRWCFVTKDFQNCALNPGCLGKGTQQRRPSIADPVQFSDSPCCVVQPQVDATRTELTTKATEDANASTEEKRTKAGDEAREKATAEVEEQKARLEAAAAAKAEADAAAAEAAAAAAAEAGEDAPAPPAAEEAEGEPAEPSETILDEAWVEGQVTAAKEAVPADEPKEITDGDVMSALVEKAVISKEALVAALAQHELSKNVEAATKLAHEKARYAAKLQADAEAAATAPAEEAPAEEATPAES